MLVPSCLDLRDSCVVRAQMTLPGTNLIDIHPVLAAKIRQRLVRPSGLQRDPGRELRRMIPTVSTSQEPLSASLTLPT